MTALTIRDATTADLPAIVAMLADDALGASREQPGPPLADCYTAAFAAIAADANQRLIVGTADGSVVATCQVSFIPGLSHKGMWRGQIESVRVASHCRGKGYGAVLMEAAIEMCCRHGCGLVQLNTNLSRTDAQRFYARLGFEHTHAGLKITL